MLCSYSCDILSIMYLYQVADYFLSLPLALLLVSLFSISVSLLLPSLVLSFSRVDVLFLDMRLGVFRTVLHAHTWYSSIENTLQQYRSSRELFQLSFSLRVGVAYVLLSIEGVYCRQHTSGKTTPHMYVHKILCTWYILLTYMALIYIYTPRVSHTHTCLTASATQSQESVIT